MDEIINVHYLENAPAGFHGMLVRNEDESYTILLDPNDTQERRLEAYQHELRHILNWDFAKADIQLIEKNNHKGEETNGTFQISGTETGGLTGEIRPDESDQQGRP